MEYIKHAEDHIQTVMDRVKKDYITKTYGIQSWTDTENFLEQLAKKCGKLLKVSDFCC